MTVLTCLIKIATRLLPGTALICLLAVVGTARPAERLALERPEKSCLVESVETRLCPESPVSKKLGERQRQHLGTTRILLVYFTSNS